MIPERGCNGHVDCSLTACYGPMCTYHRDHFIVVTHHDPTQTVRAFVPAHETMKRYFGEIERQVFSAEIACLQKNCGMCDFYRKLKKTSEMACILPKLRELVGE
ncbi:MAG: hypothetical protein M0Q91_15630 [Methanoregula sp.]|jgi:hypothetical protein|nr:hypothetical protein [Methanoregula sp.]